jgi:membrane associated rhomboid family serine protease
MRSTDLRAVITSAPMSAILVAANLAVFVAVNLDSRLLEVLALPPDWAGVAAQPWTLLTVFFTAEMLLHVAVAVLVIGVIGPRFERVAGPAHLLGVYLVAGLAGALAIVGTASVTGLDEPSVGASAAFLGLLGALAASPRRAWGPKLDVRTWIIVVVVIQLVAPVLSEVAGVGAGIGDWTSEAAHLVGLGVGAGYGYLLRPRTTRVLDEPRVPSASSPG